jgi:hypothetical protein
MPKKVYFIVCPIVVAVALVAVHYAFAQKSPVPAQPASVESKLPTFMLIHGHIGYKDMEHCFVQDSRDKKRALYLDAYTDVTGIDPKKVNLRLYNLKNGEVAMTRGHDWDVKVTDYTINIEIKAEAPPHLGPGPYTAGITVDTGARDASSSRTWSYPYGTWVDETSPIPDCSY